MTAILTEILAFVATIVALGAFWVSWREVRRNNKVIVKLNNLGAGFPTTAGGSTYELEVWIVNRGIQIQDISMTLSFHGPGKAGTFSIPIPLANESGRAASTFLRGTTARFVLSSANKQACRFLGAGSEDTCSD